jgi:hypothetical protein
MAEDPGLFLADAEDAGGSPFEFTGTYYTGTNTVTVDAAAKAHGSYGYKVNFDGTNENSALYYALGSSKSELYARGYFYISADFDLNSTWDTLGIFALSHNGTFKINFNLRTQGGGETVVGWRVVGGGITSTDDTGTYSDETFHYIDLYWRAESEADAGDGEAQAWVDGVSIYHEEDLSTGTDDITRIYVGSNGGSVPNNTDFIYFDDIKLASTGPIGAYPTGSIVPLLLSQCRRR